MTDIRERYTTKKCKDCAHFQQDGIDNPKLGVCTECNSDHFGHVLRHYHPACKELHER